MSRAMKDSGVPWLKEIPVNWKVERGKNVLALQKRPVRDNDEVVTCFRDGEVILRSLRRTEGFTMSDKEIGYQGINEGDIVIHGMDGFAGAMGVSKSTGKGSPVLIVCTPKYDAIPQYIIYYLRALAMTDVFVALATGIRERSCDLRWNKVSELEFIMPSSSEQQAIVEFLDRKCGEVDEMIGLQEQIIEELKAYKQSVITEAVTKGLNPDAPMRDSGIDWIGFIPEHWEVKRLKFVAERHNQKVSDEVLPYIGLENVESFSERFIETENEYDITQAQVCAVGDVIFGKLRPYLGKAMVIKTEHCCSSEFLVLSGSGAPLYLRYLMLSDWFVEIVNASTYGTKMPRANADYIMNMQVVCPPIDERKAIADYLDEKCADIDALIATKQQKIDSLKEYKKSIIYEYVTGKREVE